MTTAGVIIGLVFGALLLLWVVNALRHDRLYAGYGVIFVVGTLMAMAVLSVPSLLRFVTTTSVALLPAPSLSIVALVVIIVLMVYVFTQITVLSNRVALLTQELAIRNAGEESAATTEVTAE